MKRLNYSLLVMGMLCGLVLSAQEEYQYFDGPENNFGSSLEFNLDTAASNIWQVGPPQKMLFNEALTAPNALITDTINPIPDNNTSIMTFSYDLEEDQLYGILALQWAQKLDYQAGDGGMVEYSLDSLEWTNAFDSPYVYSFYGYDPNNFQQLSNGNSGFSGLDTNWRDIWLCFDNSWIWGESDSLWIRMTSYTDSIPDSDPTQPQHDGWMVDNLMSHVTFIHTVGEEQDEYMKIFPSVTSDFIAIETTKLQEYHIIEHIHVFDVSGRLVKQWEHCPTRFRIDLSDLRSGQYLIKVKTNFKTIVESVLKQ